MPLAKSCNSYWFMKAEAPLTSDWRSSFSSVKQASRIGRRFDGKDAISFRRQLLPNSC